MTIGSASRDNNDVYQGVHPDTPPFGSPYTRCPLLSRLLSLRERRDLGSDPDLFAVVGVEHENPEKADLP